MIQSSNREPQPLQELAVPKPTTPFLLYGGMVLFAVLLALAIGAISDDWRHRVDQGRARAIYELVQNSIPNRPTDTPGAIAWLHWELRRYLESMSVRGNTDPGTPPAYGDLWEWQDYRSIPADLVSWSQDLTVQPVDPLSPEQLQVIQLGDETLSVQQASLQIRDQFFVQYGDTHFVVTRRKLLGGRNVQDSSNGSNRFLHRVVPQLEAIRQRLSETPSSGGKEGASLAYRVVRLYGLGEDSTLVTLPMVGGHSEEASRQMVLREGGELSKLPKQPNFVSNEFFFIFDYDVQSDFRPFFSGLYLDLGGQGLIASLTAPFHGNGENLKGVLAMDIAYNIDWADFAGQMETPLVAAVVPLATTPLKEGWRPWRAIADGLLGDSDSRLKEAVVQLASQEQEARLFHNPSPIYHGIVEAHGALAAFQVNRDSWLVILFPQTKPRFPTGSIVFLTILLALLLAGFEWNRRRAAQAQLKAVREFREKQNLLDTMQVPLMVVDPNTEEVVYGNHAAQSLGIRPGRNFSDLVIDQPRVRSHYERMQVAAPAARRAYGLPLKVGDETRYAIIRSVAVNAPIDMIRADERHRLGIIFLLEPEGDLSLYREELIKHTQSQERRKLASLLTHGLDTLAKVLRRCLVNSQNSPEGWAFNRWLSLYLQRRLQVAAWVLDHWDAVPPLTPDCAMEADHGRATLDHYQTLFKIVRQDADLRTQLHWHNGILSEVSRGAATLTKQEKDVFSIHLDWPSNYCFTCPLKGGFGLFLGEVLINAMRHGRAGSVPQVRVFLDPVRKELFFSVENLKSPSGGAEHGKETTKKYGGRALLVKLAHLFGWNNLQFENSVSNFKVSWQVPASMRDATRSGD